jgi:GLPGLI family protein
MVSQQRLDAMPSDVRNAMLAEMKVPKLFTLEISDGISLYQKDKSTKDFNYENKEPSTIAENSFFESKIIVNKKSTSLFYYKELNNDLMLFKLTNAGIDFDGKDKLISWNWEITNETKMIGGYNCKKAISRTINSYFTAWFTEDIPIKAGPEKFDGLSGLILSVNTGYTEFTAEKIEILAAKISIVKLILPSTTATLSEMFDQASQKFEKDTKFRSKKADGIFIRTETY